MPHGVIASLSEVVQWEIPGFCSLGRNWTDFTDSPQFSSVGSNWHLSVYPGGNWIYNWISLYLYLDDTTDKKATYSFGLKRADGTVEEVTSIRAAHFKAGKGYGEQKFLAEDDLQERKSDLAPLDTLTITCRIERGTPYPEENEANSQNADSAPTNFVEMEDLSSDFQCLLKSEKTCDFTVKVQGKEFRVHRSVLAARSPVFRTMFEHDTAESKSGVLNVPDCHLESFQEFINFLYTGKIIRVTFETAYHLYSTAEKYDVKRLKSLCCNFLRQNLSADTTCNVLILSDRFCDDQLESSAQDFFNKNFKQIFLTSEWATMMKDNYRLANKILKGLASASLNPSRGTQT